MSLIPSTPQALLETCRYCDRLAAAWERWTGQQFPTLDERLREFEMLSVEATPEVARDRLRGEPWAWPVELVAEMIARARREALRPGARIQRRPRGRR